MDYFGALQSCKSMNSTLVYIENQEEIDFILTTMTNQTEVSSPNFFSAFFIGLTDHNNSGIWRFQDGTPIGYAKWISGQPDYNRAWYTIFCAMMAYGGSNWTAQSGFIYEASCNYPSGRAICKKSAVKLTNSTSTTISYTLPSTNISSQMAKYYSSVATDIGCPVQDPTFSCPWFNFTCPLPPKRYVLPNIDSSAFCEPGWTYFNHTNKCYKSIETCNSMNATLASIHGQAHNDFLISLARSLPGTDMSSFYALWIGLMEFNRTFEWNWIDGSVVDYLKWARSMPKMYLTTIDQDLPSCTILVINSTKITIPSFLWHWYYDVTSFWMDVDVIKESCYSNFSGAICQKNSTVMNRENRSNVNGSSN
uniref:C-type lectin domain-containing protein n=1 Tax=Acrobeloides nanus TaxID=290746 RepID=A0A914CPW4_9BILA